MITLQRRGIVDEYRGYSFARPSVAFDSRSRIALPGNARFESIAGRQGVWMEEGTTNLLTANQSSVETDTTGFGVVDGAVIKRVTTERWQGAASLEVDTRNFTATAPAVQIMNLTLNAGQPYTFSVWVKGPAGAKLWLVFRSVSGGIIDTSPLHTCTGLWERISYTHTPTATRTDYILRITAPTNENPVMPVFYVDGLQLEQRGYATSWTLGGTTRAAETLTVPTAGVLDPQEGTVEAWLYVPSFWQPGIPYWRRVWGIGSSVGPGMYLLTYDPTSGNMLFRIYNNAGSSTSITAAKPAVGWHLFSARWSAAEMALFIDGVKVGSAASPTIANQFADTLIYIGSRAGAATDQPNTYIGPLRISRRARTDQEIAAAYAVGYLEADADTTLLLPFAGPDAQRAAKAVVI